MRYRMLWSRALPGDIAQHPESLTVWRSEVAELRELETEQWPRKEELAQKQARLTGIIHELELEAAPAPADTEAPAAAATPEQINALAERY